MKRHRIHSTAQHSMRRRCRTAVGEEDVFWLDVSMHHVAGVQRTQHVQQRDDHLAAAGSQSRGTRVRVKTLAAAVPALAEGTSAWAAVPHSTSVEACSQLACGHQRAHLAADPLLVQGPLLGLLQVPLVKVAPSVELLQQEGLAASSTSGGESRAQAAYYCTPTLPSWPFPLC